MRQQRVVRAGSDVGDCARDGSDEVCASGVSVILTSAVQILEYAPSTSGSANSTRPGGKTSGTPPTRVDTTNKPAQAASRMPIPNASVSEGLRKICARERSWEERH